MIRLLLLTLTLAAGLATSVLAQNDPMADLRAGNAAFKDGKYEEAVQAYTRAIISGQLGAEALAVTFNNRGVAYGELGDFDRAIIDYNEALGLRPEDSTSIRNLRVGHVKRGVSEANLGQRDKAVADFTKAIELDPSHYLAYMRRGQVRADAGDLDGAVADLEKAQNLAPDNTQIVELLTRTRQTQDKSQAASSQATAAVEPAAPPREQTVTGTVPPALEAPAEPGPAAGPEDDEPEASAEIQPPRAAPRQVREAAPAPVAQTPRVARNQPAPDAERLRVRQDVNMRAGPGNDFERVTTLPGGAVGRVLGVDKGWYQLELPGGRRGWVYEKWLEPAT